MSKGENIFKRKDGRWEARYIKGRELSGKIRYGFCYGRTYREAKEKVTKFKAALAAGAAIPATDSRRRALPEHGLHASVVMHRDMVERPDCPRRLFGDLVGVDMTMCVNHLSHETFPLY